MRKSLKLIGTIALAFSLNSAAVFALDTAEFENDLLNYDYQDINEKFRVEYCDLHDLMGREELADSFKCLQYSSNDLSTGSYNTMLMYYESRIVNLTKDSNNIITGASTSPNPVESDDKHKMVYSYKLENNIYTFDSVLSQDIAKAILTMYFINQNASDEVKNTVNTYALVRSSDFLCDMETLGYCQVSSDTYKIETTTKLQDNIIEYLNNTGSNGGGVVDPVVPETPKDTTDTGSQMPEGATDAAIENPETGLSLNSILLITIGMISIVILIKIKNKNLLK